MMNRRQLLGPARLGHGLFSSPSMGPDHEHWACPKRGDGRASPQTPTRPPQRRGRDYHPVVTLKWVDFAAPV